MAPGRGRDLDGAVRAVIVVDVDGRAGERGAEAGDGLRDRRFLIVAGQQDGDARGPRTGPRGFAFAGVLAISGAPSPSVADAFTGPARRA